MICSLSAYKKYYEITKRWKIKLSKNEIEFVLCDEEEEKKHPEWKQIQDKSCKKSYVLYVNVLRITLKNLSNRMLYEVHINTFISS